MKSVRFFVARTVIVAGLAILVSSVSQAQLVLTPAGVTAGFGISTVVTGFPVGSFGPIGLTVNAAGNVLTNNDGNSTYYQFNDVDGQVLANNISTHAPGHQVRGMASGGGKNYAADSGNGRIDVVNNNGSFVSTLVSGLSIPLGLVMDPTDGNIWVANCNAGLIQKYNTTTGALLKSFSTGCADGLSISGDGSTVYGAISGAVRGYNTTTGANVFNVGISVVDGTAVGTGTIAGFIFANTNDGKLYQIDLNTSASTLIASGGSRGDFVAVDPNGTLLLTQIDRIQRLTAPQGGGFGQTPEPGTLAMIGGMGAFGGLFLVRRRRK